MVNKTWPLPALLAWAACWSVFVGLSSLGADLMPAIAAGAASGVALSLLGSTPWRRVFIALGFPLSLAASGLAAARGSDPTAVERFGSISIRSACG